MAVTPYFQKIEWNSHYNLHLPNLTCFLSHNSPWSLPISISYVQNPQATAKSHQCCAPSRFTLPPCFPSVLPPLGCRPWTRHKLLADLRDFIFSPSSEKWPSKTNQTNKYGCANPQLKIPERFVILQNFCCHQSWVLPLRENLKGFDEWALWY